MRDFYGNEYVQARWTRFKWLSEVLGYETARTKAFEVWAENVLFQLKNAGHKVESLKEWTPNFGGDILRVSIRIPALQGGDYELGIIHYDSWTRSGINPAEQIVSTLKWYAKAS